MTMNSNAAVFGICSAAESGGGYGSPQPYPTPEQLSAFYASGGGNGGSGNGGDTPPLTYHGPAGLHPGESRTGGVSGGVIETKYEPNPTSHSPTGGIIATDNGLQYANLDGSDIKGGGYPGGGGYGHPHHHAQYQAHHASLVQASYAHHYGTGRERICDYELILWYPFLVVRAN